MGNQHPSIAPYETLHTKAGQLAVAIGNDRQFAGLAHVLGRPELAADSRFATNSARVENRPSLILELETALAGRDAAEWTAALQAAGVPCGPVNDIAQAMALAEGLGLAPIVSFPSSEIATLASPLTLHRTPVHYHRAPPSLGEDNAAIHAWLDDPHAGALS